MLLWCSINTKSFINHKSSYISQFINGKSRNIQKLWRHLSGIVIQHLKLLLLIVLVDFHLLDFQVVVVLLVFFLLFCFIFKWLNIGSIIINVISFVSVMTAQTSWYQRNDYIKIFCIIYQCAVNFCNAWSKCIIFERNFYLTLIILIVSNSWKICCPFCNNKCIPIINQNWF